MAKGVMYAAYLAAMITVFSTISGYVTQIYEPVVEAVSAAADGRSWHGEEALKSTIRNFSAYIEEQFVPEQFMQE